MTTYTPGALRKFRRLPLVVDAEQFWPNEPLPFRERGAVNFDCSCEMGGQSCNLCNRFWVETIHGARVALEPGDWVIPEPDGKHFYPVKPDIFAATYEPAENGAASPGLLEALKELTQAVHSEIMQPSGQSFNRLADAQVKANKAIAQAQEGKPNG